MMHKALVLSACASASAFVLPSVPSGAAATAATAAASPAPLRAARCEMNLADRFSRLVKSNLNDLANKLEDPEKVLEQAVQDMQKDLIQVRQAYAEVSASSKRMTEQIKLAEAEGAKWYERAQLALSKGEEELAREALTRRKQQIEMGDSLRDQVDAQQGSITSLYESMKELEAKMAEAKAKKDQIIARARTAKAATKVNDMLAGVGDGSSMAAFDRMSEKVEQLEAEADVSNSHPHTPVHQRIFFSGTDLVCVCACVCVRVFGLPTRPRGLTRASPCAVFACAQVSKQLAASSPGSGGGTTIDQQFKALESGNAVDDELAAMKAAQGILPASPVDDELEQMRMKMDAEKKKE